MSDSSGLKQFSEEVEQSTREVAKDVKGKATIAKVDIDRAEKTAQQFQITSVPTLILFKDGKEVNRLVGLRNASAIKDFVEAAY